jgi:hypothetical protein
MSEQWPKLLFISILDTLNQTIQCGVACAILHRLLTERIQNEKKKAQVTQASPTSIVMFHLQSLNQSNPINSPFGLLALCVSLLAFTPSYMSIDF